MYKNLWMVVTILVAVVLLGGGFFVLNKSSEDAKSSQEKAMMTNEQTTNENSMTDDVINEKDNDSMLDNKMGTGGYVAYSKSALEDAANNRRVLFFYANWCPTCRPTDEDLNTNKDKIPNDVTIFRVNYNDTETDQEEKDLAVKYGITYQHTFVQIDNHGNQVTKWNGGKLDELLANIK